MFQTKVIEDIKTNFMFTNFFFENPAICEIMWKNTVEPDRLQMTIWRMVSTCWTATVTNIHSEYAIVKYFPRQKLLHKRFSVLRYA
jgi:hypothetical protein